MAFAVGFTSCKKDDEPTRVETTISGQIINSQTGEGLPNATLSFYDARKKSPSSSGIQPSSTTSGAVFVIETDAYGYFSSNKAYVGTFRLVITANNFYTQTISDFVISEILEENIFEPITVVQELGEGDGVLRIVLTWGVSPDDLDSHLTGPIDGSSERFHMYYSDSEPTGSNVNLDVDDTYSYGPETTTILNYTDGDYYYSVNNYENQYESGALEIYNSPAVVRVYNSTGLIKTYTAPVATATSGDTWKVFKITVSGGVATISDINTYFFFGDEYFITKK